MTGSPTGAESALSALSQSKRELLHNKPDLSAGEIVIGEWNSLTGPTSIDSPGAHKFQERRAAR